MAGLPGGQPRRGMEPTVEFAATSADSGFLPLGEALVEVVKDQFQFHSALSGNPWRRGQAGGPGRGLGLPSWSRLCKP